MKTYIILEIFNKLAWKESPNKVPCAILVDLKIGAL